MKVSLIVAVADNGVIGDGNALPWHISEDLRRFRDLTSGHVVIAGRLTQESIVTRIGKPLPSRHTVVVSRSSQSLATTCEKHGLYSKHPSNLPVLLGDRWPSSDSMDSSHSCSYLDDIKLYGSWLSSKLDGLPVNGWALPSAHGYRPSSKFEPGAVTVASGIAAALVTAAQLSEEAPKPGVVVIGGARIYAQVMTHVDTVHLTRVHSEPVGDAVMPEGWLDDFTVESSERVTTASGTDVTFQTLTRG